MRNDLVDAERLPFLELEKEEITISANPEIPAHLDGTS
jgi:hypothetical protein